MVCKEATPTTCRRPLLKQRFEVYVCTAAERGYALEAWRMLDPQVPATGRAMVSSFKG